MLFDNMMIIKSNYFFLNRNCFCTTGKNGAAIYDIYKEEIFAIDSIAGKILQECDEERCSLHRALRPYDTKKRKEVIEYFRELQDLGLGSFYDRLVIVEKLKPLITKDHLVELGKPPQLMKLWLQLTNICNLDCIHCINEIDKVSRCSCNRYLSMSPNNNHMTLSDWKSIVDDASLLECQEIHLIGGEPLLNKDLLFPLLKHTRNKNIKRIILQSNGLLMRKETINFFKSHDVIWRTSIFSHRKQLHDKVARKQGSWENLMEVLKYALEEDLLVEINIEIMKINQDDLHETISFLKDLGIKTISVDFVLSKDPGLWPDKFEKSIIKKIEDDISGVSKDLFFRNKEGHPCWNGKLAISANGNILPCIMAYKEMITSSSKVKLKDLVRDKKIEKWWGLSKEKIDTCKQCEFRYACFDCRMRESANGRLWDKSQYCQIY